MVLGILVGAGMSFVFGYVAAVAVPRSPYYDTVGTIAMGLGLAFGYLLWTSL